ncbi:MMPL family transporter [Nocardia camponoti]|uniref:Membrane protein ActII-3 n=1 Tax=Nocardia camponoti TaxID=1616106 RepID=A0A917QD51_9NOCA|nr:MMPL family transporter [Nocardia camponoti]GGK44337.1 putative membrane protein ActII-3 [Nocardia camponoti]
MSNVIDRMVRIPSGRRGKWVVLAVWIIALIALGSFAGKLAGAQKNDNINWLPSSAESTQAYHLAEPFGDADEAPVVLVYERTSGITDADRAAATADALAARGMPNIVADKVVGPITAQDGQALQVLVPIKMGSDGWSQLTKTVADLVDHAAPRPDGLSMNPTGPAGYAAEFGEAFEGIDGILLLAAGLVVIAILLITYGPMLWILPLIAAGAALVLSQSAVYGATHWGLTVNGQSAAVLTVLVFGAGTDYALLLVARYREELRKHEDKHEAMAVALRRAGPAILASGATVIIAMLALLVARMNSTAGMGPVCAVGIAVGLLAMVTLLPALLVIAGRWIFWPRHPDFGSADVSVSGIWARIGAFISPRPRAVWAVTAVVLLGLAVGISGLKTDGIAAKDAIIGESRAVAGAEVLERHFDIGTGNPVLILGKADHADALAAAVAGTAGVKSPTPPVVKDGTALIQATLTDGPDTVEAEATVDRVRAAVHAVEGADAKVGGNTATVLDIKRASAHDNRVIVPVVLVIVMGILMLLLRSVLAPILLTLTVVLSFLAALGLSRWIFDLLGFQGADPGLPLLAFVFLVALGIDYNIFLMSRVHEESQRVDTRKAALLGLSSTGGVITSAGLVLAGTFAVFTTLPLVSLAQMGIVVAVGVLLDTLIVRSILVTALTLDLGDRIWWPARPRREQPVLVTKSPEPVSVGD